MKYRKAVLLFLTLGLMAGTAAALTWLKANQKLGLPGIKAEPVPGSVAMKIELPENVLDFTSTNVPTSEVVLGYLPRDTSYAQRVYRTAGEKPLVANTLDGQFEIQASIILQGADRSSIHKPDYCLPGQGWTIPGKSIVQLPISRPQPYELSVARWTARNVLSRADGSKQEVSALYIFWFVADREQTASYDQRGKWLIRDMILKGVLQRWSYVSYFALCPPGQEDAAFEVMKKLIIASVPEFQLPPPAAEGPAAATR